MRIINCTQGSDEWLRARLGIVTASEADALLTPEFKIRTGDGVKTYLYTKIAERILNYTPDPSSWAMDQGKIGETLAIPYFEFTEGKKTRKVGFITDDDGFIGCSPDALLEGEDCGLEVKTPQPVNAIRYLLDGVVPKDYRVQLQFSLYVSKFPRWVFMSYQKSLPPLLIDVYPDPEAQAAIAEALTRFRREFDAAMSKLQPMLQQGGRA